MRRFFGIKKNKKIYIEGEEFNHLKNVLRMNIGDELLVSLNDENEYACQIEKFDKNRAVCKMIGQNECVGNPNKNIVIFQAITKRPKFEFIVQKATEIGITKIVPFVSEYVIAKVTENKIDRLNSIAMNACKQCERSIMPIIENAKKIDEVIAEFKNFDIVLFANERTDKGEKIKNLDKYQNIAIIVGSEGGFSQKEKERFVEEGATSISLGKRIYRCETASVAMMSLVSILSGN
ncbi:MAG: 16S rRNA (uracil(1498)-N(3))-methyltransferase [Clostridiales bacterium]|nr:16S rRNA (uracil(1498)-N(3))-methyltransferase [Clostridiales bacterium]